jgi:hypothetical protein
MGFSENEESFISEIRDIKNEVLEVVSECKNPMAKSKAKKVSETRNGKSSDELKELNDAVNEMIGLVKNGEW